MSSLVLALALSTTGLLAPRWEERPRTELVRWGGLTLGYGYLGGPLTWGLTTLALRAFCAPGDRACEPLPSPAPLFLPVVGPWLYHERLGSKTALGSVAWGSFCVAQVVGAGLITWGLLDRRRVLVADAPVALVPMVHPRIGDATSFIGAAAAGTF